MARRQKIREQGAPKPPSAVLAEAPPQEGTKLIESCQGLVRSLAWKIHRKLPPSVELDDMIAFGQVGLAEAARDFDPSRGYKFTTFAYYRIRGAIFDGLSEMSWFSRHEYHSSRYERMADEVLRLEVADGNGSPGGRLEEDVHWLKGITGTLAVVYLATGMDREGEGPDEGGLVDRSTPSPQAMAMEREVREKLHEIIDALPSDAGSLIRGVYFEGLTLQEAGARLGISKAWASRLHSKTLQRLAHSLRIIGISEGFSE